MAINDLCPSCGKPLATDAPRGLCPKCLLKAGLGTGVAPGPAGPTSGHPFRPPSPADLATLFPQLEIAALLGQGGMGAVYQARQPALDRWVALKILAPPAPAKLDFTERFNREARALARLNHPGVVAVYEFGQAAGLPYFVMEYVDGVTLRRFMQTQRPPPPEALRIVTQICEALQYAHDAGVVHRDIKPENILLDRKGRVKIADFGIARIVGGDTAGQAITRAQEVIGTPNYMAPEQIERPQEVDHRADIYSLGVVFYEMLTGELPLGKFAPPSHLVRLDVRLDEVVLRALEKKPQRRYQQVCEVKTEVDTIAAVSLTPEAGPKSTAPPRQRIRLALGGALALAALTTGVAVILPILVPQRSADANARPSSSQRSPADGRRPSGPGNPPPVARPPGPFQPTTPPLNPEHEGITLSYRAATRRSSNTIAGPPLLSGKPSQVFHDVGLVGYGVEVYLSFSHDVVVVDGASKKTLWAKAVGAAYSTLAFTKAQDANQGADLVLVRIATRDGSARYFDLKTGQEKFLEGAGAKVMARDDERRELRGTPIPVLQALAGPDSRLNQRRCVRITSAPQWAALWQEHAGVSAAAPKVDFTQQMVVGVFQGEGWNCKGLRLLYALDCSEALEVFVRSDDYQTGPKPDRVSAYGLWVLPKSAKQLMVKADQQGLIGGPPRWGVIAEFNALETAAKP